MGKAKPPTGLEKEFAVKADTAEIVTTQEKPAKKKAWGPVRWIGMLLILVLVCGGMITAYRYFIISAYPLQYEEYVEEAARDYGVDPALIYAVIRTESEFQPDAVSSQGAMGLMQLMPSTFEWLQDKRGQQPHYTEQQLCDPQINIDYGVYMLSILQQEFSDEVAVLSAYNAGMGITGRWLEDKDYSSDGRTLSSIPYDETRNYVQQVLASRDQYNSLYFDK